MRVTGSEVIPVLDDLNHSITMPQIQSLFKLGL